MFNFKQCYAFCTVLANTPNKQEIIEKYHIAIVQL